MTITRKQLSASQDAFLRVAALAAQHARKITWAKYHKEILASVAIVQSIRETGWGRHHAGAHNYFGLKVPSRKGWIGARIIRRTWEIIRGKKVIVDAAFRVYPNIEASFIDYASHLCHSSYYRPALELLADGNPDDLVIWIDRNGREYSTPRWEAYTRLIAQYWATDPEYGDALCDLIRGLLLRGWDAPLA